MTAGGINSPCVENQESAKENVSCDPDQEISSNPDGDRMDFESSETSLPFKKRKDDLIVEDDDEVSSGKKAISDDEQLDTDEIEESKNKSVGRVQITVGSILDYIGKRGNGGPGSGLIPMNSLRLSKILTSFDVIPLHAKLHLDLSEASELLSSPKLAKDDSNAYLESLIGFDEQDRKYEMMLMGYICGKNVRYWLCGGWTQFVRNHRLKPGDEINFYKGARDEDVSREGYFVLRYFRRPLDPINKKNTIQGGPVSRTLPPEAYCISKVLTSDDVDPEKSMLELNTYDAIILVECPEIVDYRPGTFREVLIAYDELGEKYDMDLCHVASETEKVYAVSDEWICFAWDHKLEAGDVISFYKNVDTSIVRDGYYYIVKYERKSKEEDRGDDHHENDNDQVMVKEKADYRTCDGEDEVKQKALGSEI